MSERLRVLMISEYPFSDKEQGRGGILQSTFHLIEGFQELGGGAIELHILSQTPACDRYETRIELGVTIHFVPRGEREVDKFLLNPWRLFLSLMKLRLSLRPHIIHGQGAPLAILLSQNFGIRNIQTIHGIYRNEQAALSLKGVSLGRRIRMRLNEAVERHYLRRAKNVVTLTSEIRRLVTEATSGAARLFPSYVAIDAGFFRAAGQSARALDDPFVILFVAAITPRKGLHFLIDAFERLCTDFPGVQLRVVGMWDWAPEYVASLQQKHRELIDSSRLVFTGSVRRDELIKEYEGADAFVLPSLSESAPAVVSQAMCMGIPLVATRVGGIPEMVDHENTGLLVEPANVADLESSLRLLLSDTVLRNRLGEAARGVALTRYSPRAVAAATLAAYEAVARNGS